MKISGQSVKETVTKGQSRTSDDVREEIVDEIKVPLTTFKLVVVGESCKICRNLVTGKTSLIRRFLSSHYESEYNVTVGADFISKPVEVQDGSEKVQLQIWDTVNFKLFSVVMMSIEV